MNWNFFKTNWFSIALVILLMAALLRGSGHILMSRGTNGAEKFTHSTENPKNPTALGLASSPENASTAPLEIDQTASLAFLKRFSSVAVSERKKFGVPASVLLAISFLNSQAGLADAATGANNFFGLPCSTDWEGETATYGNKCMRQYETPWESWRDFSIHLSSQEWFGSLKKSAGKDWKKWASGLGNKDVSSFSNAGSKIAEVVQFYHLYDLDH